MGSSKYLLLVAMFFINTLQSVYADGIFKWKDAQGNIQYGDEPPKNVKLDKFKMPKIMVVNGFKEQWKPRQNSTPKTTPTKQNTVSTPVITLDQSSGYTKLAFIAPRMNQVIKSGFEGEVSAMLSLKPPLKKSHQIVFLLDGKEVAKGKSRINNFSNLSHGKHTLVTKIIDQRGKTLKTSLPISFSILRK